MRIVSSQPVIESTIKVVRVITDTYNQPNETPEEIEAMISDGTVDMLLSFSEADARSLSRVYKFDSPQVAARVCRLTASLCNARAARRWG
jgi:hypothetical protein